METDIDSITQAGVLFIVYLFIALVVYFVLSTPVDLILDALFGIQTDLSTAHSVRLEPYYAAAVKIAFVCLIAYPVTRFIFWVFKEEPYQGRIRLR